LSLYALGLRFGSLFGHSDIKRHSEARVNYSIGPIRGNWSRIDLLDVAVASVSQHPSQAEPGKQALPDHSI